MMQGRARDDHGDGLDLITLKFRLHVPGTLRRLRINTDSLVASRSEHGIEAAQRLASDLGHRNRRDRQLSADERPDRGEPAIIRRHPPATTTQHRGQMRPAPGAAGLAVPMSRVPEHAMQGCARVADGADEVEDSRRGCPFVRDGTVITAFGDCPGLTPAASLPAGSGTCVLPR